MKNLWALVFVVMIIGVLSLFLFSFQVRETEVALVTRFGKPVKSVDEPGWNLRWPPPINVIYKFDSRGQLYESVLEDTTTRGGDPINVTSYIVWRIGDPQKFLESVHDTTGAERVLDSLLRNTQNSVIGQYYFSDFVNSDPAKIKFAEIEEKMAESIRGHAMEEYGIEIDLIGIKKLGISKDITKEVFARMRADRKRRTEEILAEGWAEAEKIKSEANSTRDELLAVVQAEAKAIRGKGDAEAAKYYKMLESEPELAMFLRDIETLRTILKEKTTIILTEDNDLMKYLKGIPDITPNK